MELQKQFLFLIHIPEDAVVGIQNCWQITSKFWVGNVYSASTWHLTEFAWKRWKYWWICCVWPPFTKMKVWVGIPHPENVMSSWWWLSPWKGAIYQQGTILGEEIPCECGEPGMLECSMCSTKGSKGGLPFPMFLVCFGSDGFSNAHISPETNSFLHGRRRPSHFDFPIKTSLWRRGKTFRVWHSNSGVGRYMGKFWAKCPGMSGIRCGCVVGISCIVLDVSSIDSTWSCLLCLKRIHGYGWIRVILGETIM